MFFPVVLYRTYSRRQASARNPRAIPPTSIPTSAHSRRAPTPNLDGHVLPTQSSPPPPHPSVTTGPALYYAPKSQSPTQQYHRSNLDFVSSYYDGNGGGGSSSLLWLGGRRPVRKHSPLWQLPTPRPKLSLGRTDQRAIRQ